MMLGEASSGLIWRYAARTKAVVTTRRYSGVGVCPRLIGENGYRVGHARAKGLFHSRVQVTDLHIFFSGGTA